MARPVIARLTDLGTRDPYVGAMITVSGASAFGHFGAGAGTPVTVRRRRAL